jgi:alpha-L-arabinofuranosidase
LIKKKETIIKIVNTDSISKDLKINTQNINLGNVAEIITLKGNDLTSENNFSNENIKPVKKNKNQ